MKFFYLLFLCTIVNSVNAQTKNYEFSFSSKKATLTMEISNYSDSVELRSVRKFTGTLDNKNSKIYFTIDENKDDVVVNFRIPNEYETGGPIKRVSDKKKHAFFFNSSTDTFNKIVPLSLLVEFKNDSNDDLKEALSKILNCKQIEDINKEDIELLLKRSHEMIIITYKIEL